MVSATQQLTLDVRALGERARGTFGPQRPLSDEELQKIVDDLGRPEFWIEAPQKFVGGCSDERPGANGLRLLLPPSFGGFASVVLANALTTRQFYQPGMTFRMHALAMLRHLQTVEDGLIACIHTDTQHATDEKACGCAAIKLAADVLELLVEYQDLIDPDYRDDIVANARELMAGGYFEKDASAEFVKDLDEKGAVVETLTGDHDGLVVVRNEIPGMVYNRSEMPVPFFEVAAWAFGPTADTLISSKKGQRAFVEGLEALNKVIPYAICNPNMLRITVKAAP